MSMVMQMKDPKNITEVCRMLGLTSRTIRYYEQCGLIRTERKSPTAPRRLNDENIERLRKIRFLQRLGLSLEEIASVIDSEEKAAEMVRAKESSFRKEINSMILHVNMLKEVLAAVEKGDRIYDVADRLDHPYDEDEMLRVASACTKLLLERRFEELKSMLDEELKAMPTEFYAAGWEAHLIPCGKFLSVGEQKIVADTVITPLHCEKKDIIILTEIHCGIVTGFLLRYDDETN